MKWESMDAMKGGCAMYQERAAKRTGTYTEEELPMGYSRLIYALVPICALIALAIVAILPV